MARIAELPPTMRGYYVDQDIRDSTVRGAIRDDLPTPSVVAEPEGVVVKVLATAVSSDALRFVRGQYLAQLAPFPSIAGTGAIGIVYGIGKDVIAEEPLRIGDLVLCTCYIGDETNGILKGLIHFGTDASKKLQKRWREGSWAEYALFPAGNVYPLRGSYVNTLPPSLLARIERTTISYSALKAGGFQAGQIVAIGGATGTLGSGCLSMALALGASKIFAFGRKASALESLLKALGPNAERRVVPLAMDSTNSDEQFAAECFQAFRTHGAPDLYLDALGVTPSTFLTTLGIRGLKAGGTAVLFGGVRGEIPLPYGDIVTRRITLTGSFMYSKKDVREVVNMIDAGIVNLNWMSMDEFRLDNIQEAMEHAAVAKGERGTVLVFERGETPLHTSSGSVDSSPSCPHAPLPTSSSSSPRPSSS